MSSRKLRGCDLGRVAARLLGTSAALAFVLALLVLREVLCGVPWAEQLASADVQQAKVRL